MDSLKSKTSELLDSHGNVFRNIERSDLITHTVRYGEAMVSSAGALAAWTPQESTGRCPKDTMFVRRPSSESKIDWTSPNNIPVDEDTFKMIFSDALKELEKKERLYITDRVVGADPKYALPVKTVTDRALTALFTDNMFRMPEDISKSVFHKNGFLIIVLPYDKLDYEKYSGRLRINPATGKTSDLAIIADFDNMVGIVFGSAYCGSVKKLIFTVMNYVLPDVGIFPLHCSANEGAAGDSVAYLGLSGTGKTTISAVATRALLGDDEHGWSDEGIFNFENGCYAKMININPVKEPDIYDAVMHKDDYVDHGVIVENAMIYPGGNFNFYDSRLTENSRASYPLKYLKNIKESSVSGHPEIMIFLTADANGVLPPVAKLTREQAMLWFIMGYTSKLAGTEAGILEPVSTFSRFFGQPFMPRNPDVYAGMLGEKLKKHSTKVFLINTGWTGGPYGTGKRIDIDYTRAMVSAAIEGKLDNVSYKRNEIFNLDVPLECPGVPSEILDPSLQWESLKEYETRAKKLASEFTAHFDKEFLGKNIDDEVARQCPGR